MRSMPLPRAPSHPIRNAGPSPIDPHDRQTTPITPMHKPSTTIPRRYADDPALLEQQLRQAQDREQYYEQQRKILLHEQAQLDRRKRNRRIFTRGGMLEAFMKKPLLLNDDQVYRLLKTAFSTKEVQDMENTLLSEASHGTGCDGVGSAGSAVPG